jgi:hypothetical protein
MWKKANAEVHPEDQRQNAFPNLTRVHQHAVLWKKTRQLWTRMIEKDVSFSISLLD